MSGVAGIGHAFRFLAAACALVVLVCAVLAAAAGVVLGSLTARLDATTGRTYGVVTAVGPGTVEVRWTPPGGIERTDQVPVAGAPPPTDTRTEVAFDPSGAYGPLVPGASVLASAELALTRLVLAAATAVLVLGVTAWHILTRRRVGPPGCSVPARRVRVQAGTLPRSWVQIESVPRRWIPVHFDPVLLTMLSPGPVELRGDPARNRLVAIEAQGQLLLPSGPVRVAEPRGRHVENPSEPDATAAGRGEAAARLRRRFAAALPLTVPAPLVALLWTWAGGGGAGGWLGVTALLSALAFWYAALRGADPT